MSDRRSVAGRAVATGMRGQAVSLALTFPRELEAGAAVAALRALAGLLPPWWRRPFGRPRVVLELHAEAGVINHTLTLPTGHADYVVGALRAALPGLRIESATRPPLRPLTLTRELRKVGPGVLRSSEVAATNAAVLATLQPLTPGERVVVQFVLAPVGRQLRPLWESGARRPRADEQLEPELAMALRVGVHAAAAARAGQLIARLLGPFHAVSSDRARLVRVPLPPALAGWRLRRAARVDGFGSVLGVDEIAACAGIPVDGPQLPGLTLTGSRELPAAVSIPREGLVLGDSTLSGPRRPLAVSLTEIRRGLHICAPTGAGKSTLLLNLAVQVMDAGLGLVLLDPKGDLAAGVLDRIPASRDVVVFDPADRQRVVGLNLIGGAAEHELVVDHVVGELRARYGAAGLGPRSEDILRACLMTLAATPGLTICEVEPLLTIPAFRARLVGRLDEPVLERFWGWYGSLSEAARAEAIAPLANKLRVYTLRRRVRAVIGQSGGLDLAAALEGGHLVIASLATGLIGDDAAGLLGAAMTSRLWAAIQARAAVPEAERRPAVIICDEFQTVARLPLAFGDAVAQSRGYGVGWVLAHQHLQQLDADTRQAVLANCRSRLVAQTTATDAAAFAREFAPFLAAPDLQGLPAFQGYATISTGAAVSPPASVRLRPACPARGTAARVRAISAARYGVTPAEVDAQIRARVDQGRPATPVGGIRRSS